MKKLTMITTTALCMAMLTACSTSNGTATSNGTVTSSEVPSSSETTTEAVAPDENKMIPPSEGQPEINTQDYEAQLDLIASNYDSLDE